MYFITICWFFLLLCQFSSLLTNMPEMQEFKKKTNLTLIRKQSLKTFLGGAITFIHVIIQHQTVQLPPGQRVLCLFFFLFVK